MSKNEYFIFSYYGGIMPLTIEEMDNVMSKNEGSFHALMWELKVTPSGNIIKGKELNRDNIWELDNQ